MLNTSHLANHFSNLVKPYQFGEVSYMASERRRLRKQQRLMAAEMIGTLLDRPEAKGLDPDLRLRCEHMMANPKALDAVINHLHNLPAPEVLSPPCKPAGLTMVAEMYLEWMRRVDEHEREGV